MINFFPCIVNKVDNNLNLLAKIINNIFFSLHNLYVFLQFLNFSFLKKKIKLFLISLRVSIENNLNRIPEN